MPELPEVETIRLGIEQQLLNEKVLGISFSSYSLRIPTPKKSNQKLLTSQLVAVSRRAKYLLLQFDNGFTLVTHLGMSGTIRIENPYLKTKHDHMQIHFSSQQHLIFNDPRRFGMIKLIKTESLQEDKQFIKLGLEPLEKELSVSYLKKRFFRSTKNIKTTLLDQSIICGIGNIYASEILFLSEINPLKVVSTLSEPQLASLIFATKKVLQKAIKAGGSSLNDYAQVDGSMGYFLLYAKVYNQAGKSCSRSNCHGIIQKMLQAGRSTYFCPKCQH